MSSGSGYETTSQGNNKSAVSQTSSEVGLTKNQSGSASTDDQLHPPSEHINYQPTIIVNYSKMNLLFYRQNHSNMHTLGNNLIALKIKYS